MGLICWLKSSCSSSCCYPVISLFFFPPWAHTRGSKVSAAFCEVASHGLFVARIWVSSDDENKPFQFSPSFRSQQIPNVAYYQAYSSARRGGICWCPAHCVYAHAHAFALHDPYLYSHASASHLLRMSHIRNSVRRRSTFSRYLTSGILSVDVPPSSDISHPAPDAAWERKAIQLPRSDMSGSSDSAYPESIRSRQFRFPGQLCSSDTHDSSDPFPPTIFYSS